MLKISCARGWARYFETDFCAENDRNCQKSAKSDMFGGSENYENPNQCGKFLLQWTVKCLTLPLTIKTGKKKQILKPKIMGAI